MPVCAVNGCTIGYKTNFEKAHFFKAPRNLEELQKWQKVLHKPELKSEHYVCHKHFTNEEVLWQKILRAADGSVLGISPYKIPRLQKNAIPSQNLTPTQPANKELLPLESTSSPKCLEHSFCEIVDNSTIIANGTETLEIECTHDPGNDTRTSTIHSPSFQSEPFRSKSQQLSFDRIISCLVMPPGYFAGCVSENSQRIMSISERGFVKVNDTYNTFTKKEIILSVDLKVQINILHESVEPSKLNISSKINDIEELQNIINILDKVTVCAGSHQSSEFRIDCNIIKKDVCQSWRHIKCPLIIFDSVKCIFCRRARKTVARKMQRLQTLRTLMEPRRIKLSSSPSQKRQLVSLKSKLCSAQKNLKRNKHAMDKVRDQLNTCREKMRTYSKKTIIQHLDPVKELKSFVYGSTTCLMP